LSFFLSFLALSSVSVSILTSPAIDLGTFQVQRQFVETWNRVYGTNWTTDDMELDKNTSSRYLKAKQ